MSKVRVREEGGGRGREGGHASGQVAAARADVEDFGACFEEGRGGEAFSVLEGGLGGWRGKERDGGEKKGEGKGKMRKEGEGKAVR
jgi:hypothetical protein